MDTRASPRHRERGDGPERTPPSARPRRRRCTYDTHRRCIGHVRRINELSSCLGGAAGVSFDDKRGRIESATGIPTVEPGLVATEEAAAGGTTLFRAVGSEEAADIADTGTYRIAGDSVRGGKYFYPTQEQAQSLVDRGWAMHVTSGTFSQEAIDAATPLNIASEGPGYYIPEQFFPHGPVTFLGGPN